MRSFTGILQQLIIRRSANKRPVRRLKLMNFQKVRKVCLLLALSEKDDATILYKAKQEYEQLQKEVDIFVFPAFKSLPPQLTASQYQLIKKEELNIAGLPDKKTRDMLSRQSCDLMVYYNPGNYAPVAYAATLIKALIIAGTPGTQAYTPEIVLHTKKEGLLHFIHVVNYYLNNIKQSL